MSTELQEIITLFVEQGIATDDIADNLALPVDDHFLEIRNYLAAYDIHDKTFNELTQTLPEDYNLVSPAPLIIRPLDQPDFKPIVLAVLLNNPPKSILASHDISATLYIAHTTGSFPVFLHPRLKKVMAYKYLQYKRGLEVLESYSKDITSPIDFRSSFGEVTFDIANSVISSELIASKTPEQIIKYRNAMNDARQTFLSNNLMEVASIIQDNPWNSKTKEEVEKYIMGKLKRDILQYNEASHVTWEKLFGNIGVHIAQIAKNTVIGGSAGGLVGNLIPNTSTWHMLLIGALLGAVNEAPNLANSIKEKVLENRAARRSSIAYIAEFK